MTSRARTIGRTGRNICASILEKSRELVMRDKALVFVLLEWHGRDRQCADLRGKVFWDWLDDNLDYAGGQLGDMIAKEGITPEQVVSALGVNAMGDPLAIFLAKSAEKDGFRSDINCYVEDGVVNSSVWLESKSAEKTKERADIMANMFIADGYCVDVYVDEEDDREATVNAQLDFPLYLDRQKNKKAAERTEI